MSTRKIEHALISVSDKTGLVGFAQGLASLGVKIYASGGTRGHLEASGIAVTEVAVYTGFPEMMDGRLKTLHPKIHGGILGRHDHPADMASLAEHGIVPFELVVVNLYAFEQTIQQPGVTHAQAIEKIDIGGPTLVRGAAKNHAFVTIASCPSQYDEILNQLKATGATTPELRRKLAGEAFALTARYDAAIARYFADSSPSSPDEGVEQGRVPGQLVADLQLKRELRYGENPHQTAGLYVGADACGHSLVDAEQLHGKELSYNNLLDLDAALAIARSLPTPGVAVLKHNNPCGAGTGDSPAAALEKAWSGDPVSAFGSILGFNVAVDAASAEFLAEPGRFVEAIVAPEFEPDALEILTTKPKWRANVRLLQVGKPPASRRDFILRSIDGGYLAQLPDNEPDDESQWREVTKATVADSVRRDLCFAWAACRHVKSNAIVLAKEETLIGVGAGQMSRVDAVEIAIRKAGARAKGSVLASDAFFPFDDSIRQAAEAGVVAVIQPGGSRRDDEVIAACNELGLAMVMTGRRHFRH